VFSPALSNGFVEWDDYANLFENPGFRGLGWAQLRWMFTSTLMGHYIPVTWLTFGLDYTIWGMNPLGYHLTNVLLHAANVAAVYVIARRLLAAATALAGPALRVGAAIATLFFALHPLRAESVAWATERRDVLSALFFLLTVLAYLRAAETEGAARRRRLLLSVACYALALLSKSIVMTLPVVLVLLDLYPLRRLDGRPRTWASAAARPVWMEKVPYLVLGLAGAAGSLWAVASHDYLTSSARYGWAARLAMTGYSLAFYAEKTLLPVALSPLYELPAAVHPLEARFLMRELAVIAISLAVLAARRRWPAALALWVYYGLTLAPVSGIVHAGFQLSHDRYSYLSCLGWALLLGAGVGAAARAGQTGALRPWYGRAAALVAAAWILALGTLTWYQVQIWRDTETLWRHAVDADAACAICQSNLGSAFYRQKLYALAREHYELALALRPDRLRGHGNLAVALDGLGQFDAAMPHHRIAVDAYPNEPDVLTNLAASLVAQKRYPEALPLLERATRINPSFVPALVTLGGALIDTGRAREALGGLLRALQLDPGEPVLRFNLARAYLALGDRSAARAQYDALRTLDPERARAIEPALAASS
jgi:tetratricopeptide (TPR) repeat protein